MFCKIPDLRLAEQVSWDQEDMGNKHMCMPLWHTIIHVYYKYQLIVDHCSICTFHGTSTYFAKTTLQLLSQTDCRLLRQLVDAGGTLPSFWNWIRFPTLKAPGFSDFTKTNTENSRKASSISEKKLMTMCVSNASCGLLQHRIWTQQPRLQQDDKTMKKTPHNHQISFTVLHTTWQGSMASHSRVLVYHGPENKLPPKLGVAPRLLKSHPPLHQKLTATLPVKNAGKKSRSFSFPFLFKRSNPAFQVRKNPYVRFTQRVTKKMLKTLPDKTSWTIWCAVPRGHIPTSVAQSDNRRLVTL